MKSKHLFQDEARAIACFALVQGYFSELPLAKLADLSPSLTPLSEDDVIGLMKGASIAIENLLALKKMEPRVYWNTIKIYRRAYEDDWQKD